MKNQKEKRTSKLNKILNAISVIVFLIVLGLTVFAFVNNMRNESTGFFGYKMFVVKSESMEPTLMVDDVLLDKEYDGKVLDVGTIITFNSQQGATYIINTHRIVGYYFSYTNNGNTVYEKDSHRFKTEEEFYSYYNPNGENSIQIAGYITKGDNPKAIEDTNPVLFSDIEGVYVRSLPVLTWFYGLVGSFWGFLFILLIPLVIIVIIQICSMILEYNKQKTKEEIEKLEKEKLDEEERIKKQAIEEYIKKQEENDTN